MPGDTPTLAELFRCPICKRELTARADAYACAPCAKQYPIVLGIPDFRLYEDPLIPLADDYRKGEKMQLQAERLGFDDLVRYYWSLPTYPPTTDDRKAAFIHHVLTDEQRVATYVDSVGRGDTFLEIGCGTAALTKLAQPQFRLAVASDVGFRWLIVARRRLQEDGLPPLVVCCCADYLPFAAGSFDAVGSVALLEHVRDAATVAAECARVLKNSGRLFLSTTNRFSVAPEPHVGLWGVGFLPRAWMPRYVKWRRGLAYEKKHLLSVFEVRRMLRRAGFQKPRFSLPRITPADLEQRGALERSGARVFSFVGKIPWLRSLLRIVSPVIQVVARTKQGNRTAAIEPKPYAAEVNA